VNTLRKFTAGVILKLSTKNFLMPITRHLAKILITESKHKPLGPEILLLGRQTVFLTPDQAQQIVVSLGCDLRNTPITYSTTSDSPKNTFISDKSFFSLFCDSEVLACDVSDYEGADLVFDLSSEIPKSCTSRFDFIYNGSVLDNIFNSARALSNSSSMLKASGVAFHYEGMLHLGGAYVKFTPEWFFDYFAINNFTECQSFVCTFNDVHESDWLLHEWRPYFSRGNQISITPPLDIRNHAIVISVAEKGLYSTTEEQPIQAIYRSDHTPYINLANRSENSLRWAKYREICGSVYFPGHTLIGSIT